MARFIQWPQLVGLGSSRKEAIGELRKSFEIYRQQKPLPRPGEKVPIEFAPSLELQALEVQPAEIFSDFFESVLGVERISVRPNRHRLSGQLEEFTKLKLSCRARFDIESRVRLE